MVSFEVSFPAASEEAYDPIETIADAEISIDRGTEYIEGVFCDCGWTEIASEQSWQARARRHVENTGHTQIGILALHELDVLGLDPADQVDVDVDDVLDEVEQEGLA